MAEAEDVIVDAARHATIYARQYWARHRRREPGDEEPTAPDSVELRDIARRLDLLVRAVFGTAFPFRSAQAPLAPTLLTLFFSRRKTPQPSAALPATNDRAIWLPTPSLAYGELGAFAFMRTTALRLAMRASRGSAAVYASIAEPLVADIYLLVETQVADVALTRLLPGSVGDLEALREHALRTRPPVSEWPEAYRPLESFVRDLLKNRCDSLPEAITGVRTADQSLRRARDLATRLAPQLATSNRYEALFKDSWTGELLALDRVVSSPDLSSAVEPLATQSAPRVARLARRPQVRESLADEDDEAPGPWMVQPSVPNEHVEDPLGLQRPADRDDEIAAEEHADSFGELREARVVSQPGRPKELLLADDPLALIKQHSAALTVNAAESLNYPEWDYRLRAYRERGATVRLIDPQLGSQAWVDESLAANKGMIDSIRRRFEALRSEPVVLRRQLDGDDIDLEACVEAFVDRRVGIAMPQAVYQTRRPIRKDLSILLLVDISGSTDAWVAGKRRVIDIEREALLWVCTALEGMAERYSVQCFSGDGPRDVRVTTLKEFAEPYSNEVARRVAALEPDQYTRVGAALRHATASLMKQATEQRLLLLLSDGKPNDLDVYDGRYGVEDTRQALIETRLQGIAPFCLTIDRQAADYLPGLFGPGQYAMLPRPELLPSVLIDWLRRLVAR